MKGSSIRTRHIGRNLQAVFRDIVGGEVRQYVEMMNSTRGDAKNDRRGQSSGSRRCDRHPVHDGDGNARRGGGVRIRDVRQNQLIGLVRSICP